MVIPIIIEAPDASAAFIIVIYWAHAFSTEQLFFWLCENIPVFLPTNSDRRDSPSRDFYQGIVVVRGKKQIVPRLYRVPLDYYRNLRATYQLRMLRSCLHPRIEYHHMREWILIGFSVKFFL